MHNASMKDFCVSGCLGAICLGASREEVQKLVGNPEQVGGISRKQRKPSIWKFGDVELHFAISEDNLELIHLDDFDVPAGGELLSLDAWIIQRNLTSMEAQKQLLKNQIAYQIVDWECEEQSTMIITCGGVRLLFIKDQRGRDYLSSVSRSNHTFV